MAEQLVNYAGVVGKENVQTGTDCGIGSRVGHAEVVWAKLQAMAEGARLASDHLWGQIEGCHGRKAGVDDPLDRSAGNNDTWVTNPTPLWKELDEHGRY